MLRLINVLSNIGADRSFVSVFLSFAPFWIDFNRALLDISDDVINTRASRPNGLEGLKDRKYSNFRGYETVKSCMQLNAKIKSDKFL